MAVSGESSPAALVSGNKLGGPDALPKCYDVKKHGKMKYGGVFVGAGVVWLSCVFVHKAFVLMDMTAFTCNFH